MGPPSPTLRHVAAFISGGALPASMFRLALLFCLQWVLFPNGPASIARAETVDIKFLGSDPPTYHYGFCTSLVSVADNFRWTTNDRPNSEISDDITALAIDGQLHYAAEPRQVGIRSGLGWFSYPVRIPADGRNGSVKFELLDIDGNGNIISVLGTKYISYDQICPRASVTLTMTSSVISFSSEGQTINYTYELINVGLSPVYIASSANDQGNKVGTITCMDRNDSVWMGSNKLDPGSRTTCTSSYTVTAVDLGSTLGFSATIYVTPSLMVLSIPVTDPNGWYAGATASGTIAFEAQPSWTLAAVPSATTYSTIGQSIGYSFTLRNTGNVAISTIGVTGTKTGAIQCLASSLAPAAITTCASTYVTEAADIGTEIVFTATATGSPASGALAPISTSGRLTYQAQPTLTLTATTSPTTFSAPGQPITFTYTVTNPGNVAVTALNMTDTRVAPITCAATTLATGASTTCTGTTLATAADVNAKLIISMATARGTFAGLPVVSPTITTTVKIDAEVIRRATASAIQGFMSNRANAIASTRPDTGRLHDRLGQPLFGGAADPNTPAGLGGL